MKIEELTKQLKIKETEIESNRNIADTLREQEKEIINNLYDLRVKEYGKNINTIVPIIKKMFNILENNKYPDNMGCSHFGVWYGNEYFLITMSSVGDTNTYTQIFIELRKPWVGYKQMRLNYKEWSKIREVIDKQYKITEHWNGEDKCESMTVIINKKCPTSLIKGQKNYKFMGDNEFNSLFDKYIGKLKR